MALSTFTIGGTVCTFQATINGSSQDAPEPEKFVCTAYFSTVAEWTDAVTLVTSKYHVHLPLGGNAIIDVVRGLGVGALVLSGIGSTSALLVGLTRNRYLSSGRSFATMTFIRTAVWV
jgi:hypothetical protein